MIVVWVLVGVAITILLLWGIKAIQGVQYWKRCETEFAEMISRGSTKEKALLRISMKRHPELSTDTHKAIIGKFSELPLLVNFFTGALPDGRLDDEVALKVLEDTTIDCLGPNRYKVKTRSIQKKQSPKETALPQVKEETGLQKNRETDMARGVWKNALSEEVRSILSIGSAKEAKEIIEAFLIPDKIDPLKFSYNCEALLRRGTPSLGDIVDPEKSPKPTPSVSRFTAVWDRPSFAPLWFIAAYPDVLMWHDNQLREYKTAHGRDEDGLAAFNAKLFGLDLTDPNLEKRLDNFIDSEGNPRPNTLRNLLQSYKEETGRQLETALKEQAV